MTRLLFVSTSTTIGGAEKTLLTLATRLDKNRFQVTGAVSLKPKGPIANQLETAGVTVDSLELTSIPGPAAVRRLAQIIERTKPDIVHALMYQAIQLCRMAKRRRGTDFKLVSSPRVNYRSRSVPSLWLDRFLKAQDDLLISESEASARFLTECLGYEPARVITIHNGVETAQPHGGDREAARQQLRVGPDDFLLGAVGRLDEQKGYPYLLEAVAKLRVLHPVRVALVGEGPLEGDLKQLAEELRISEHVTFLGRQADLGRWYSAMDLFVLPSLWEGLPNSVLEAMSFGLAVAATRVDGVPEVVADGVTGRLCAPRDSQSLFEAIQELIVKKDLRRAMSEAGLRRVNEQFRLQDMLRAYESAYDRLVPPS